MAEDSAITVHRTSPADMQERELYVSVDGAANVRGKNFGILATFLGSGPMQTVLEREA